MKNEFIAHSCRICLTKTKKLRSLYKPIDEGDEPPYKMLYLITGIKVEKLDKHLTLPKNICKNCELSLSMAFEFRENALKTQQTILAYLKELDENGSNRESDKSTLSMYNSEYEDILKIEQLDCMVGLEEDIQNLSGEEHNCTLENDGELNDVINAGENFEEEDDIDIYNQQETFDINDSNQSNCNENTNESFVDQEQEDGELDQVNMEHENVVCDDQGSIEYIEEQVEIMPAESENLIYNTKNFTRTNTVKATNKNSCKISTKLPKTKAKISEVLIENMKLIPRRGRKPSNNVNQNGHICDICGNVFAKRGRMMEHRQRHDKECRFCCEICDKKFLTRELLRKHMFSHSGGKPLKCQFCSRTFYYESVRKAHEAVHKGLRPYICDDCGKAFNYAHALKKHKLIHAEIKLYRCEYCNKDFRLQHHMKQHELTKLHQNAIRFAKDCGQILKGDENLDENILFVEEIPDNHLSGNC